MLKNKFIVKKIRNICILVMALIIMLGAYSNIRNSRAEKIESVSANIIDSDGFLANELIDLEITNDKDNVYEIELPEAVTSKIIDEFVSIMLANIDNTEDNSASGTSETANTQLEQASTTSSEIATNQAEANGTATNGAETEGAETEANVVDANATETGAVEVEENVVEEPKEINVEIVDGNKIYIEKEDLKNKELRINVKYDAQFLEIADDGTMSKKKAESISEEEKEQKQITSAQILYKRKLKYEDEENGKLVEVKGYMPKDIKLKVEEVQKESLTEILENAEIDIAYDIKLIKEYLKFVPVDENIKLEDIPIDDLKFVSETMQSAQNTAQNTETMQNTEAVQKQETKFNTEAVLNENTTENGLATPVITTTNANGEEQSETGKRQIWEYNIIDEQTGEIKETKQIEFKEILEIEEVDPKTYDENCEVTIKDTSIRDKVNIYHITENDTYERITPTENEKETVTFNANTFSIYVVGTDATSKNIENVEMLGASSGNISFSGPSTGTWHSSVTVTASPGNSDVTIKGVGFSTTAGENPGINGSTSATKSSTGTWYFNVVYGLISEQESASQGTYYAYSGPYKVDATAPSTPSISKSPSTSSWTTSSVTVSASGGSDSHSGFNYYQHKTGSGSWSSGSSVTLSSSGNYTVYFRSVDNVGNVSDSKSTTVKIDKTKPTISFAKESSSSTWAKSYSIKVTIADAHSGLASGGSVKYGWSTSNSTSPESWTTVELSNSAGASSTSFTAKCSGYATGKYYLWVKPITLEDEVGNEKTGTEITSGKFWVDRTKPKDVTISPTSEATWAKSHTVTLTMEDAHSGLAADNVLTFQWSKDGTNQPDSFGGTRSPSYTDGSGSATATINKTTGSGKFYLWVQPETYEDVAGNSNTTVVKAGEFWFDNTVPEVGCPSGDTSYKKERDEPITIYDAHSGLKAGASVKYGWSTSNTTEPSSWTTVNPTYTAGTKTVSFAAHGEGMNGQYYLWVKASGVSDMVGNTNDASLVSTTTFGFDCGAPTISASPTTNTTWVKTQTVTINMADSLSGLSSSTQIRYGWSTSTTTAPSYSTMNPGFTEGAKTGSFTITASELSGIYYLWIDASSATDVAGNTISSTQKYGPFYLDNIPPEIIYSLEKYETWRQTQDVLVTISDQQSGIATGCSVKYGWSTSNTKEPDHYVTQSISVSAGTKEYSFHATLSSVTGKFYLWVKPITLKDVVGNENTETKISEGTFWCDNTKPTIKLNSATVQSGLLVSYDASNNTGGGYDASATHWTDLSGHEMDGVVHGGTWKDGEYLSVDGVDDAVAIGQLDCTDAITLEITIVPRTISTTQDSPILGNWDLSGSGLQINTNGQLQMQAFSSNADDYTYAISDEKVVVGQKYHVVGTYDGSNLKLYVNGELKKSTPMTGTIKHSDGNCIFAAGANPASWTTTTTNPSGGAYDSFANIDIYQMKIYNRALTIEEVNQNGGTSNGGVTRNGLRAEYDASGYTGKLHDNNAVYWQDLTGNIEYPAPIHGGSWENEEYLSLDGTDDWVNLRPMTLTSTATLDITITPKSIQSGEADLLANFENGGIGLLLSNGSAGVNVYIAGSGYETLCAPEVLTVGQKYHIVGTYDGTTIKLYVNGELKRSKAVSGTIGQPTSGTPMAIGANPEASGDALVAFANVNVYNAKIYDRALTATEITSNYNGTKVTTNLIREFDAYDNTAGRLVWKDLAGADDNGVIYNGAEFVNGEYLSLNGVDQRVNLTEMNFANITLEATITPKSIQTGEVAILANWENGGYGIRLYNGQPSMLVYIDGVGYKDAISPDAVQIGQKYHIVGTYDGTTIKLYINGELKASTAITGTIGTSQGTTIMTIGVNPSGKAYPQSNLYGYANINVYNARVYDRAITATEVTNNLTASENQAGVWAKEHYVDVTLEDAHSGLASGNNIKYGWGYNTVSTPNSNLSTAPLSYTAGANSYTFTASGGGITGKYYLWVIPSTYKDVAGNSNNSSVISTEQYWFDNKGPVWTISNLNKDQVNKFVTLNLLGADEHSGYARNSLTANDITVWVDGVEVTNITKVLSRGNETGSGVQYKLTLANFEEATRQDGKPYKEWSGNVAIKIKEGTMVDVLGNESEAHTLSLGHIDFINPEFTYQYSETDIDQTNKTVKIQFTVTDKYFYQSQLTQSTIDDLTILIDGEEPIWKGSRTDMPNYGVTRTLTSEPITETREGESVVVGYNYTLVLSDLEQSKVLSGDNYLNYSGTITVSIPAGEFSDTSGNTNKAQVISLGLDIFETDTATSNVYVPAGYSYVEGDMETGYVIEDPSGNQYVWVDVPKTSAVYPNAGTDITKFTDAEFELIESDLHSYTSAYRRSDKYSDEYAGTTATSGLTENEYNTQKKKMLKSVYKNGGFYIGRYETGIDYSQGQRTANGETTQTPVIKANAYPYDWVTTAQAQNLASSMATGEYTSSLLFGVQWDLTLKYIETKGTTQAELKTDSTSWGNYYMSSYNITNTNSKYTTSWNGSFKDGAYGAKTANTRVYLTTGASETFQKQRIYDLAGNALDKTLEFYVNDGQICNVNRGWSWGYWLNGGTEVSYPYAWAYTERFDLQGESAGGFRVALYKDEGIGADSTTTEPTYIPTGYSHVEGTSMETGYVVADSNGNEYVWVEVPQTEEVYQTAGLGITSFTTADYELIEQDLQSYTSVYRESWANDEYSGNDATLGLTESAYNNLKKKMLKSVYKNGGFYIGRYETGIDYSQGARVDGDQSNTNQTPIIKKDAYPYGLVTSSQAQTLASSMANSGYTSNLLFGVQWDLTLKYLETKGSTQAEMFEDSAGWGNYKDSEFTITSNNAKASFASLGGSWITAEKGTKKASGTTGQISTGASDSLMKQNIYDLAGNNMEWTLESAGSELSAIYRGGEQYYDVSVSGSNTPASHDANAITVTYASRGFRVALYKDEGTGTDSTEPTYIPEGYSHVEGTSMETGYVVADSSGNEYVWVEVPKSASVYTTAGTNITDFTEAEFALIEQDLQNYTSDYKLEDNCVDEYSGTDESTGLTENEYYTLKKKMLKSIYTNGGFYVGRYETGIDYSQGARTSAGDSVTQTPVIKRNAYPYNYVTSAQSQNLAETFTTSGYQSSLLFGVQWDLMLKYIEASGGATKDELLTDSTYLGNYKNNLWTITNTNSRYSTDGSWSSSSYGTKTSAVQVYLTTGASDTFSRKNIYDFTGNVRQWTLEYNNTAESSITIARSAYAGSEGTGWPAARRTSNTTTFSDIHWGFRVALYKDEGTGVADSEPTYIPEGYSHVSGTDMDSGYVISDSKGNEYVWVEVPRTATVYKTAGLGIVQFTSEDYDKIEADLKTYTASWEVGYDEYFSSTNAGMTENEYNAQKRKMLKSVYKNGGFYVGRYEMGIEGSYRSESGDATQIPVIKKNVYPYNFVTLAQAQTLAQSFSSTGYSTSLMFGVQWNLIMEYLKSKGMTETEIRTDLDLGNYYKRTYSITNTNAKYSVAGINEWQSATNKTIDTSTWVIFTTGATDNFKLQNIYDLGGNAWEWVLSTTKSTSTPNIVRGGSAYNDTGWLANAASRASEVNDPAHVARVALYKDENDTEPEYTPNDFTQVEGTDLDTGYVVKDTSGNEYVWVEVPKTTAVYKTAGLNISQFTDAEYSRIEKDLQDYTSTYRSGTTYVDEYSGNQTSTGLNKDEYYTLKKKMLKSIYKNGGFYIGRYETGIDYSQGARTSAGDSTTQTPVIKQNAYPYNYVTVAQSQSLAETFAMSGYQSSLLFGIQWDLTLKYIEESGAATQAELLTDSTNIGNYKNNLYNITNTSSKYSPSGNTWTSGAYGQKSSSADILLTTGASDTFQKKNIYDLAGNAYEGTLEYNPSGSSTDTVVYRGGSCYFEGTEYTASSRNYNSNLSYANKTVGFRVALFKDEGVGVDDGLIADVVDPFWRAENIVKDVSNQTVELDLIGSDKYFKESTLTANDLSITVDGVNITELGYANIEFGEEEQLREDRDGDGVAEVQYGVKHHLKITNWEEPTVRDGNPYKEWSGETNIVVEADTLSDKYGNISKQQNVSLGQVDLIRPIIKYTYSEADINYTTKTVAINFSIADKYIQRDMGLSASQLTVLVDGEEPAWKKVDGTVMGTSGACKTLTKTSVTVKNTATGTLSTKDVDYVLQTNERVVAVNYKLLLENLEQDPNDGFHYSGPVTVSFPANVAVDSYGNYNNATTITVGVDETGFDGEGGNVTSAGTFLPSGFTQVEGTDLTNGLTIQDSSGNQYVWVEVPQTTEVYANAGLDITEFTQAEINIIEEDLMTYTSTYEEEGCLDTWLSEETTGLTETEYNELKNKMLKSVYKYGGFYIGKYETGIENSYRNYGAEYDTEHTITETPVIKANAYPYNWVRCSQAQTLASSMQSGEHTSSLMFGIQWDLVMKYLETKGTTQYELKTSSIDWGNFHGNSSYSITNTNAKYSAYVEDTDTFSEYLTAPYSNTPENIALLTTGASETFSKMGIYDLAGNVAEWTLEGSLEDSVSYSILRGGACEVGICGVNVHTGFTYDLSAPNVRF